MTTVDRVGYLGDPLLELGVDTGDVPVLTNPNSGPSAVRANTEFRQGASLEGPINSIRPHPRRLLGRVDISDVVHPNRFRRVYQSIRVRRNEHYRGPIQVEFRTHIGAIIQEELGTLAPTPSPASMPDRIQTTTTHSGGRITGAQQTRHTPPPVTTRETITGGSLPFDQSFDDRLQALNSISERYATPGSEVDRSMLDEADLEALNGEGTDTTLEALANIFRPRTWIRQTVLEIRFRYPIMEPMLPATMWDSSPIAFGDSFWEQQQNSSLQNTIEEFVLFSGSTHVIEIPYPVGSSMPLTFDIVNHNPLYSANVHMSASAYVTLE